MKLFLQQHPTSLLTQLCSKGKDIWKRKKKLQLVQPNHKKSYKFFRMSPYRNFELCKLRKEAQKTYRNKQPIKF